MNVSITKVLRSLLCLVLALCLVAGAVPAAFAEETPDSILDMEREELAEKMIGFLQEFWPQVDESLEGRDPVEYITRDTSYYVALGDASVAGENTYVDLLAAELGLGENYLNLGNADMKLADETYAVIESNAEAIEKADLITLGFSAHVFLSNAVAQGMNHLLGSGAYMDMDWEGLVGPEYAADVDMLINDVRELMAMEGITGKKADLIVNIAESAGYSATNYAIHLPELIATIREYNKDCAIVVVGMYNPMDNATIKVEDHEMVLGEYMEMLMEAADEHAAACCNTTPDAAYVPAPYVETISEADGDVLNVDVSNAMSLVPFATAVRKKMIPSEAGNTYIKNRILQKIVPIFRVAGETRFETSFLVADHLKASLNVKKFDSAIIASGATFADALSGSYLATVKNAPILLSFTQESINQQVVDYISKNLTEDGVVYILGGEAAVPKSMDEALSAYTVIRLAGANRFETNLMVLREAGVGDKEILVCTGTDYADSLAASATGLPILLVYKELYETQKEYLFGLNKQNKLCVIGGESAVNKGLEESLDAYGETNRVYGTNRINTSVKIAEEFFSNTEKMVVATGWQFADGLCGGALAYSLGAPLMLTLERFEAPIAEYAEYNRIDEGVILGGQNAVSDAAADASFGK